MKCLIVEDDFTTRNFIQKYLVGYGDCDVAVDGVEAIEGFRKALAEKKPYDLICLDIMMPHMDGHQVLTTIRKIESEHDILDLNGTKVIMMTSLKDGKNVIGAFKEGCEAYLTKPVGKKQLLEKIEELGIVKLKAD